MLKIKYLRLVRVRICRSQLRKISRVVYPQEMPATSIRFRSARRGGGLQLHEADMRRLIRWICVEVGIRVSPQVERIIDLATRWIIATRLLMSFL